MLYRSYDGTIFLMQRFLVHKLDWGRASRLNKLFHVSRSFLADTSARIANL